MLELHELHQEYRSLGSRAVRSHTLPPGYSNDAQDPPVQFNIRACFVD